MGILNIRIFLLVCSVYYTDGLLDDPVGVWWLRGISNFAISGRYFSLSCTIPDGVPGVVWKRDGVVMATVLTDRCQVYKNTSESRFAFKCSGSHYMRVEMTPVTEDDYNKKWECYSILGEKYGNSSFIPYVKAAVEYVTLHDSISSNCDHAVSFTCVTGPSRPASDIWWHTADKVLSLSGVSQKDYTSEVKPNLFVTSSSITLPLSNAPVNETIYCTAMNIIQEGRTSSNVINVMI